MELATVLDSLEGLPCPFTWLKELTSEKLGENCTLQERWDFVTKKWISGCNQARGEGQFDSILDRCNPKNPRYTAVFTRNLTQAIRGIYEGDLEVARGKIAEFMEYFPELTGDHERLKEPMKYLINCLEWVMQKMEGNGGDHLELETLRGKWEALQEDRKSKAVLVYVKAFIRNPGRRTDGFMNSLREVIQLDPDYFIWYHNAYRALFVARRENRQVKVYKAPSKEEIDMARKAYEVASEPKPEMVVTNYVKMLGHCLMLIVNRANCEVDPYPLEDVGPIELAYDTLLQLSEECLQYLQDGIWLEKGVSKILTRRATVLLNINSTKESRQEGLQILLDAVRIHPGNGFFWWTLGEIYQYGVPDYRSLQNPEESRNCFLKVINLGWRRYYFRSLHKYVKLFSRLRDPFDQRVEEALKLITHATDEDLLEQVGHKALVGIWKGCLLWNKSGNVDRNRMDACRTWLNVWMTYPTKRENLMNIRKESKQFKSPIDMNELRSAFVSLKWEPDLGQEQKQAVCALLEEIKKQIAGEREMRSNVREQDGLHYGSDFGIMRGGVAGEAGRGRQYPRGQHSAADEDVAWRVP